MKMRGGEEYYWLSELCVRRDLTSKFNNFCNTWTQVLSYISEYQVFHWVNLIF